MFKIKSAHIRKVLVLHAKVKTDTAGTRAVNLFGNDINGQSDRDAVCHCVCIRGTDRCELRRECLAGAVRIILRGDRYGSDRQRFNCKSKRAESAKTTADTDVVYTDIGNVVHMRENGLTLLFSPGNTGGIIMYRFDAIRICNGRTAHRKVTSAHRDQQHWCSSGTGFVTSAGKTVLCNNQCQHQDHQREFFKSIHY